MLLRIFGISISSHFAYVFTVNLYDGVQYLYLLYNYNKDIYTDYNI